MNSNSQTLIVIMPVYNSEKTLSTAIDSILSQSYRNLRLIIVDDASSDSSLDIAKTYLKDSRVYVLQNNKNMGAYYSRNAGLYFVKDQTWGYFTTHDSDDKSYEHRYVKLIRQLKHGKTLAVQDVFRKIDYYSGRKISASLTMAHAVFKREIFKRIGYFELVRFGADWEHWQRLNASIKNSNYTTSAVNETLGDSFIHQNNLTVQIPINSRARRDYIARTRKNIARLVKERRLYRHFDLDNEITRIVK